MKIFIINGPNINLLGIREPDIYGKESYNDLLKKIALWSKELNIDVEVFQSNVEGEIVNQIQKAYFDNATGIVINPAAYTHTSIAILDALKAIKIPYVEVHISDINEREDFRKISLIKEGAFKTISGKGLEGYHEALIELKRNWEGKENG